MPYIPSQYCSEWFPTWRAGMRGEAEEGQANNYAWLEPHVEGYMVGRNGECRG